MKQFDYAQELEMTQREAAIEKVRRRFAPMPGGLEVDTALDCLECGAEIPEQRRSAVPGTMLCVDCQGAHEKQQKRGMR